MKKFVNSWDCQRLQSTAERPKTEALNIINATENYRACQRQLLQQQKRAR